MSINNNTGQFRLALAGYMKIRSDAPNFVGTIAVNFFKRSFDLQGQKINGTVKKWKKRGPGPTRRKGRQLLIDKGRLRRGITKRSTTKSVKIGVDAFVKDYATLMNDGGTVPITLKMRKFFWAMYYQSAGKMTYKVKTRKATGKKNAALSADAEFWRNMALTKKTEITIPARPFIYDSKDLVDEITKELMKRIAKIIHK